MIFCEARDCGLENNVDCGHGSNGRLPPQALRTELSVLHEEPGAIKCNRICAK
jgi:hypothetical protein